MSHELEAEASVRLLVTEALLLLSASKEVRELMRAVGIYPLIRESHLVEEDGDVIEANEMLVDEFYLSGYDAPGDGAAKAGMCHPFAPEGSLTPDSAGDAVGQSRIADDDGDALARAERLAEREKARAAAWALAAAPPVATLKQPV